MKLLMAISLPLTLLIGQAVAGEPAVTGTAKPVADTEKAAKPSPDDRICTRERVIGSNMAQRVCRTRAQMEADRADAREAVERANVSRDLHR